MANFVSTTTPGYSDPLKATAIKALEARQKDMQAQIAAAQAGGITPENTQTPIQGVGHLANQLGDSFRVARVDRAAAEGRNELAGVIAQGPKGSDGNWSPEQLAVMSRRDPEFMSKLIGQQHERGNIRITEEGLYKRNDATIGGQNSRSAAEIAGREKVAGIEQLNANQRNDANIGSAQTINKANITSASELQSGRFGQEAHMARLNAAIDEAKQEKLYAQQNGLRDKETAADEKMARLRAELTTTENKRAEEHQATVLDKKFANDEKLQRLTAELNAAESAKARAFQNKDHIAQREADERIVRIRADLDLGKSAIQQAHEKALQTQAEGATATNLNTKVEADKAAALEASRAAAQTKSDDEYRLSQRPHDDAAKVELDFKNGQITREQADARLRLLTSRPPSEQKLIIDQRDKAIELQSNLQELDKAYEIISSPKGIHSGNAVGTPLKTAIGSVIPESLGGPDSETQANTQRFNQIMKSQGIKTLLDMKGASSDKDVTLNLEIANDPSQPLQARKDALAIVRNKLYTHVQTNKRDVAEAGGAYPELQTAPGGAPAAAGPDKNAAARAWLANPANKNDPDYEAVRRKVEGR